MCGDRFISCLLDVHIIPKTTLRQSVLDSHFNHPPSCTDATGPRHARTPRHPAPLPLLQAFRSSARMAYPLESLRLRQNSVCRQWSENTSILGPNNLRQPRSLASRSAGNLRRVSHALSQSHIVSTSLPQWTQMTGRPSATLLSQPHPQATIAMQLFISANTLL